MEDTKFATPAGAITAPGSNLCTREEIEGFGMWASLRLKTMSYIYYLPPMLELSLDKTNYHTDV